MEAPAEKTPLIEDTTRRQRAKDRLYVIAQTVGWLGFLAMQIAFTQLLRRSDATVSRIDETAQTTYVLLLGWLLSHYARPFIARWRWKELGWLPLIPRVLGMAAVLSVAWTGLGYGYVYGVLGETWSAKIAPSVALALSIVNGSILFVGWLCVYFFYHLFDRFNRLEIERLRLQTSVKDAELRALKSQINPHFIFNSLNSLRALIDENPAQARSAVTQLANLLRYSLQSGQLETVALEDELRVVKDYLALEQVRHEDRLRVRFDVSPGTGALSVPPMLVQTLVENAVKYGIAPRRDGGEIALEARAVGDVLRLRVSNPGTLGRTGPQNSTGMGIKNAAERLRLLFGERARLTLREEAPGLVVAEVEVPLEVRRPESAAPSPQAAVR